MIHKWYRRCPTKAVCHSVSSIGQYSHWHLSETTHYGVGVFEWLSTMHAMHDLVILLKSTPLRLGNQHNTQHMHRRLLTWRCHNYCTFLAHGSHCAEQRMEIIERFRERRRCGNVPSPMNCCIIHNDVVFLKKLRSVEVGVWRSPHLTFGGAFQESAVPKNW